MSKPSEPASPQPRTPPGDALLATKLYIPPVRPGLVPRPRLLARLDRGLEARLILLSGPAGGGKTTLLSAWLAQRQIPAAWLSLEPGDSDPRRFLGYLVAALRTVVPGAGELSQALLQAVPLPPLESLLTTLINEIVAHAPDGRSVILVLDDYHAIESTAIHDGITFLLEHLPPAMRLVIATRVDPPLPLARFRARGQMVELRASDLRFTRDETTAFLNGEMKLGLAADAVATLEARVEGWIAGLQMLAISMQGRSPRDLDECISSFSGSHRHIMDYMVDEVLSRQPEGIQAFLLRTSVLERLSGPLCEAVSGLEGGQATLEHLERANLFLVPLDDERRWYRYHHLFADLLRARLRQTEPGLDPTLHQRAAGWYEQHGLLREAIHHALAAGDDERAARLVDAEAEGLLIWGEYTTLVTWAGALPWEVLQRRAWLCVCCGWSALWLGRNEEAERWLQAAERRAGEAPHTEEAGRALGAVAAVRARAAYQGNDLAGALHHSRLALQLLPGDAFLFRVVAAHILGDACFDQGDVGTAEQAWSEELRVAQQTGNAGLLIYPWRALSMAYRERGQLRRAEAACRQAFELAGERSAGHWWRGRLGATLGDILWERGEREAALHQLREALAHDRAWRETLAEPTTCCALADALRANGDLDEAAALMETAEQLARAGGLARRVLCRVETSCVRLWLARGDLGAAERWVRSRPAQRDALPGLLQEMEAITCARVALAGRRPAEALALLAPLAQAAEKQQRNGKLIEILVLQALAHQATGGAAQAPACLARALTLAEQEGYVRVFVDEGAPMARFLAEIKGHGKTDGLDGYVERLLMAAGGAFPAAPPSSGFRLAEPLSARELEVLRLLAGGLTNNEIARQLVVTLPTVKSHTASIYGKLGVNSRREAVVRATRLGILP